MEAGVPIPWEVVTPAAFKDALVRRHTPEVLVGSCMADQPYDTLTATVTGI